MSTQVKRKVGRPSFEISEREQKLILDLYKYGHRDIDIVRIFDFRETTYKRWLRRHPDFKEMARMSKMLADKAVIESLYNRAKGMTIRDVYREIATDENGEKHVISMRVTEKDLPPDTVACKYWLNNRDPENWRERQENNVDGTVKVVVTRKIE